MEGLLAQRYQLETIVGSGGMGTVWRAHDILLDRQAAIKEVRYSAQLTDAERQEQTTRAVAEARHAARLEHPRIVPIYDVLIHDARPWIVMRYIAGQSLEQHVLAHGRLPTAEVFRLARGLLEALEAAHRGGVLHRDVKPSNVLMAGDGEPMLTDFSIARAIGQGTATNTGLIVGSPGYIAPERVVTGVAGPEADLFGLGATLFFAAEGVAPFAHEDAMVGAFAAAIHPHPRPQHAGPILIPILDGLLEKDPRTRLTMAAAAERLAVPTTLTGSSPAPAPADSLPTTDTLGTPHTASAAADPFSAAPGAFAAAPGVFSAAPGVFSAAPGAFAAAPGAFAAAPGAFAAAPGAFAAAPDPLPAAPGAFSAAPDPLPAAPDPLPAAPGAFSAAPDPLPAAPDPLPAAPDPLPAAPGAFSAETPVAPTDGGSPWAASASAAVGSSLGAGAGAGVGVGEPDTVEELGTFARGRAEIVFPAIAEQEPEGPKRWISGRLALVAAVVVAIAAGAAALAQVTGRSSKDGAAPAVSVTQQPSPTGTPAVSPSTAPTATASTPPPATKSVPPKTTRPASSPFFTAELKTFGASWQPGMDCISNHAEPARALDASACLLSPAPVPDVTKAASRRVDVMLEQFAPGQADKNMGCGAPAYPIAGMATAKVDQPGTSGNRAGFYCETTGNLTSNGNVVGVCTYVMWTSGDNRMLGMLHNCFTFADEGTGFRPTTGMLSYLRSLWNARA